MLIFAQSPVSLATNITTCYHVGPICCTAVRRESPLDLLPSHRSNTDSILLLQVQCLVSSLNSSTCSPADQACLCHDQHYSSTVSSCVLNSCDVPDALLVKNATWSGCGFPEPNRDSSLRAAVIVITAVTSIFFILRILSRVVKIAQWGWDDTTCTFAFVSPFSVTAHPTRCCLY